MKEKIERFARGEFDDVLPKLEIPKNPVSWEMEPETSFTGYLKLHSENGVRIRGYVVSSDGNLKLNSPQFFGKNLRIEFVYKSKNMMDGDKKCGKFILITNAGEFLIPFEVQIRKKALEGGSGDE